MALPNTDWQAHAPQGETIYMEHTDANSTPTHRNDEHRWAALMVNAQAGSEADYRQLLTELSDVIHGFLRNRFGESHFTEDCVQEALIAVHEARHTYDSRRPFRPWLFAIVRHKAIDTLRRHDVRHKATSRYRDSQEVLAQVEHVGEAEAHMAGGQLLDSLPEAYREALVLTKIIGLSVAEAAERLGIKQSLVKVRVHRAIKKLRNNMELETP